MIKQKFFNYQFKELKDQDNYFVNSTNKNAFDIIISDSFDQNIILFGPNKSGKSHLLNIWLNKNNALLFDNNFNLILKSKTNVAIDDILKNKSQEEIFHIINHCKSFNLKILVSSNEQLIINNFKFKDLYSRLRTFYSIKINDPDEEMCKILLIKLFHEKQIIIKNNEILDFIYKRVTRTYKDIYFFVEKIDRLSLEKKRQLTIPLIKEIL